jgi:hypothetical protein
MASSFQPPGEERIEHEKSLPLYVCSDDMILFPCKRTLLAILVLNNIMPSRRKFL